MAMKYAFSTLGCPQWTTEQVAENAIKYGYSGIELRLLDKKVIDPVEDADKVRQAVATYRARGLTVCAFDTSCRFNVSDPVERAQNVESLRTWIRLAQELDVPLLRVFGGDGTGENIEQENTWVIDALREVAPDAERAGVTVMLETHDGFASAYRCATVLNAVNSPAIAALWDSHHPYRMGETAQEVWDVLGPRIAHVHVKDARKDSNEKSGWQLVLVGEGEVPVRGQLEILHRYGYDGYVSVEWEKHWHPEIAEPEIALPQHIQWLKATEQEIAK